MLTLDRDPSSIPSALIGKPAPAFEMPPLEGIEIAGAPARGFSGANFAGNITIVNVFASWCGPCRDEHKYVTALADYKDVQLFGLNYKDKARNALSFLDELGNPYNRIGVDPKGKAAIEWGVYGIPETFLIDPKGNIFYKHVGPLTSAILLKEFIPRIAELRQMRDNSSS